MASGETCIDVGHLTTTTTVIDEEITLTFDDILEMFSDRGVNTDDITAATLRVRNFGGLVDKILTPENEVIFRIKKTTVVEV